MTTDLSLPAARRIALAAQGFADRRPASAPTRTHLKRVLNRTKLLQIDSVNILARAHHVPVFSRLGPYDDDLVAHAAWRSTSRAPRLLAEYWAHEAAMVPIDDWPLFRWRMREFADGRWRYTRETLRRNRGLVDDVLAVITDAGPSTPRGIEEALGVVRPKGEGGSWWNRSEVKHICEAIFASGMVSAVRDDRFVRYYDLAERVVGAERVALDIPEAAAHRELVARAGEAHGIATLADLADYYRLKTGQARAVLGGLIDDGTLTQVSVEGWTEPAYLHRDARIPRSILASALLSPFDPLIFYRPRTQRLFGFHYRIEIYVPEAKRVHGYYVLPYLLDEQLVARVDLKADRGSGILHVRAAYHEVGAAVGRVADALAGDLRAMADWRGLSDIVVHPRGDLAPALSVAMGLGAIG